MTDIVNGVAPTEDIDDLVPDEEFDPVVETSVEPRALVPTPRQVEGGAAREEYRFVDRLKGKSAEKAPFKAKVREYVSGLDPRRVNGPKLPLYVFIGLALLTGIDDQVFGLIYPELRAEFAAPLGPLLILGQLLTLLTILLQPVWGWLSDRVKRVYLLRIAALGQNVLSIGMGLAQSMAHLYGALIMTGLFVSAGLPAQSTLMADYYRRGELAKLYPLLTALGNIPLIVGPIVAGLLIDGLGWRGALILLGGLATVVSVATFLLKEPVRGELERKERGATDEEAAVELPAVKFAEAWRMLASITTVRKMWYATPFFYAGVFGVAFALQQYWAERFALTPGQRGFIYSAQALVSLIGTMVFVNFLPRLMRVSPGRIMTIAAALLVWLAGICVALLVSNTLWISLVVALPMLMIQQLTMPPYGALFGLLMLEVTPARIRGVGVTSSAPFSLVGSLLFVIAPAAMAQVTGTAPGAVVGAATYMLSFIPLILIGAYIFATASTGVDRDMRAARATAAAEMEARRAKQEGRSKMLVCRGVEVSYSGTQVLFGVDFDLEEGEIVAMLGTNGAGKSTILKAIAGINPASTGAIFLDGVDITREPPHKNAARGIVMMPGGHAIFPTLTVRENLRTAGWMYREDEDYLATRTEEVLQFFPRLRERLDQVAGTLSGGEQQMVALGQAFLMKPRLLMIDELSLGLAPAIVEQLLEILRAAHKQGTTIVLVEQSLNVALTIADRAVFMEKGKIRFDGQTSALLERPDLIRSVFMGGATSGKGATTKRRATADDNAPFLTVSDISVRFGGVQALSNVSLDVAQGEIVGIIGPNGAGKTTLFDVISGFVQPSSGHVFLGDQDVTDARPDVRAIAGLGRSFQNVRLFPSITVRENIAVALEQRAAKNPVASLLWTSGARKAEARLYRRVDGLIELLGLKAFADKFVGELSTGSRRAVEVACMLGAEPKILLLDEPSSGLAQAETEELGPVLERVVQETGCGLLMIEHDMPLITSVSNRLVAMELGRVLRIGTPAEVQNDPRVLGSYLAASNDVIERSGTRVHAIAAALGVIDDADAAARPRRSRTSRRAEPAPDPENR